MQSLMYMFDVMMDTKMMHNPNMFAVGHTLVGLVSLNIEHMIVEAALHPG